MQLEIETADINEVEIEKQKLVTKQRIKDALRKILIVSKNGHRNPLNSLQVTSDIPTTPSQNVNSGAETPLSSSSPGLDQNRKTTKDHVDDLIIDGAKRVVNQSIESDIKLDVVTVVVEKDDESRVSEVISSCCEKEKDYVSRDLAKDILEAEEEHVDWLETQLSLIDRLGEQNYLQTAMQTVKPN